MPSENKTPAVSSEAAAYIYDFVDVDTGTVEQRVSIKDPTGTSRRVSNVRAPTAAAPHMTGAQKPVAWQWLSLNGYWVSCKDKQEADIWEKEGKKIRALYITPPAPSTVCSIKPMHLSGGRTDYFVSIKKGDREVTPHVFYEEFKAAYHVALYDWLLNDGPVPDLMAFNEEEFPAQRVQPAPSSADSGMLAAAHRHKKRGTEYALLGIGKMQTSEWYEGLGHEDASASVDMRDVAIYRSVDDGSLWVRPREEFEDGRFEALAAAEAATPAEGWVLVPVKPTDEMSYRAAVAHYGKRRVDAAGGIGGISMTVNGIDYNFRKAFMRFWKGALSAAPKGGR